MDIGPANITFAATLVDQWIACGLRAAFVAPGSRSTPLAVALANRSELRLELFHDERSASFAALGWGLATATPAVLLCTSGTAATHFHAAVAEAGLSCVPMLVCTANRPPELWGVGAPQTIDQHDLYRQSVRKFVQLRPPDESDPAGWRELANSTWAIAANPVSPGPVQVDLSFREPLLGDLAELPTAIDPPEPPTVPSPSDESIQTTVDRLVDGEGVRPGVIVIGRGQSDGAAIERLAATLGWPIIADHRSGLRGDHSLRLHDALLRSSAAVLNETDRILRFGEPLSSKVLTQWITRIGHSSDGSINPDAVTGFVPWSRVINPEGVVSHQLPEFGAADRLVAAIQARGVAPRPHWLARWNELHESVCGRVLPLVENPMTEPGVAIAAVEAVPTGGALVVSSSMPVRDVEWFGPQRSDISVYSNRGANGIDGVVATAAGIATTGVPTVCLIGDVALLHDQSTLTALARRSINLTIVVVDNDGGGIFGMLPQKTELSEATYELLFGTPHGTDLSALFAAHSIPVVNDMAAVGVRAVIVTTGRPETLALRDRINRS